MKWASFMKINKSNLEESKSICSTENWKNEAVYISHNTSLKTWSYCRIMIFTEMWFDKIKDDDLEKNLEIVTAYFEEIKKMRVDREDSYSQSYELTELKMIEDQLCSIGNAIRYYNQDKTSILGDRINQKIINLKICIDDIKIMFSFDYGKPKSIFGSTRSLDNSLPYDLKCIDGIIELTHPQVCNYSKRDFTKAVDCDNALNEEKDWSELQKTLIIEESKQQVPTALEDKQESNEIFKDDNIQNDMPESQYKDRKNERNEKQHTIRDIIDKLWDILLLLTLLFWLVFLVFPLVVNRNHSLTTQKQFSTDHPNNCTSNNNVKRIKTNFSTLKTLTQNQFFDIYDKTKKFQWKRDSANFEFEPRLDLPEERDLLTKFKSTQFSIVKKIDLYPIKNSDGYLLEFLYKSAPSETFHFSGPYNDLILVSFYIDGLKQILSGVTKTAYFLNSLFTTEDLEKVVNASSNTENLVFSYSSFNLETQPKFDGWNYKINSIKITEAWTHNNWKNDLTDIKMIIKAIANSWMKYSIKVFGVKGWYIANYLIEDEFKIYQMGQVRVNNY